MGWIGRSLLAFVAGPDPEVHPRTRVGRALPMVGVIAGLLSFILAYEQSHGSPAGILGAVLIAIPIGLVATRPLLAWRFALLAAVFTGIVRFYDEGSPWPWQPIQVASLPIILAVVAVRHPRGVVVWTGVSAAALVLGFVNPSNVAGILLLVVAILVIGDQIRRRREVQRALADEEERTALAQARRAVAEERNRIAREMHDVVAHHMSLIAVRAETAVYRIEGVPPAVAEELQAIAGTSREALAEMRRLLGVLRNHDEPLKEPQPVLDDLGVLVRDARSAGVQVSYAPLPGAQVPPGVGLAAFRIVQEALSNARRHAPGAAVEIRLSGNAGNIVIVVRNGSTGAPPPPEGKGHGLLGMRERAAAIGGTLEAGFTDDGGYQVRAVLPLDGDS